MSFMLVIPWREAGNNFRIVFETDFIVRQQNQQSLQNPQQALRGSTRLRLPDFMKIGTWRRLSLQPYAPAAFTPRIYSWYSFLLEAESTPGPYTAAGRIMPMKNCNDTIGNRTRDISGCSAVPQPTAPPRALIRKQWRKYKNQRWTPTCV